MIAGSMTPNIAISATSVKCKCCEIRGYSSVSISATLDFMREVIDGEWIKKHLQGHRGEKAELARALGVRPDIISKIINGERAVQPEELPTLLEFFDLQLVPASSPEAGTAAILAIASTLNDEGLALLQQQIAALANIPSLSRTKKEPMKES